MHRNGLIRAAALAAMVAGGAASALADNTPAGGPSAVPLVHSDLALTSQAGRTVYLDDAPAQPAPLMALLNNVGVGQALTNARINVGGDVEGSYTYSFSSPPGNLITGRLFDIEHEDPTLNQIMVFAERTVDPAAAAKSGQFDIGARMEWRYGADSRFIHSLGLFDHYGFHDGSPENQFDLTQAYVDFAVPVGNGLLVRVGKQVTPIGYEVIDPTGNPLFSHSFLFDYAIPFTNTGVFLAYQLTPELTVNAAVTRGWDTTLEDNNGAVDFLGWVNYQISKDSSLQVSLISGPEQTGDNGNYRTLVDVIYKTQVGDNLALAFNGDYAYEANSASSVSGSDAQWWGVAGYATYTVSPQLKVNLRGEYFNDDDGARLTGAVGGTSVWEATAGLAITPFPGNQYLGTLTVRPEIRFDYANKSFFDGGTDHYQFTAAIDATYKF